MSLATRCTHCGTIFKVVQDQLKVSEGWVRCGRCNEVFHAIPTLFDLDTEPPPPRSTPASPAAFPAGSSAAATPAAAPPTQAAPFQEAEDLPAFLTRRSADTAPPAFEPTEPAGIVADLPADVTAPPPDTVPPTWPAADELFEQPMPWRDTPRFEAAPPEPPPRPAATDFELDTAVALVPDADAPADEAGPAQAAPADMVSSAEAATRGPRDDDEVPRTDESDALDSRFLMPSRSDRKAAFRRRHGPEFADAQFPNDALLDLDDEWGLSEPALSDEAQDLPAAAPSQPAPAAWREGVEPAALAGETQEPSAPRAGAEALSEPPLAPSAPRPPQAGDSDFVPEQPVPPPSQRRGRSRLRLREQAPPTPGFMKQAQRRAFWRHPATRAALGGATVALVLALGLQLTHQFRDLIAAHHPDTRPQLQQWCDLVGCRLAPPLRLDDLQVESATLVRATSEGAERYRLAVVVHNRARIGLAWPHIDLTLTDANGAVIARRAFAPREARWLDTAEPRTDNPRSLVASGPLPEAVPPGHSTTLLWDLKVSALSPAGYTAELFYP